MGQEEVRSNISNVTNADPCVITTSTDHNLSTGDVIRLTDLNGRIPTPRGEDQLNNRRFKVVVTSSTEFKIKDPITDEYIDSTNYVPYVSGGSCNLFNQEYNYT